MRRALASLFLLVAFLLSFAGSASAYVDYGSKKRVGDFGDPFAPQVGFAAPFALEPHQENTIAVYDPATGVLFYVRQNPWTFFDPLGLNSEWHHEYPVEYENRFKEMDIDVHESERGVLLEREDHKKIHGKGKVLDYNKEWQGFFDDLDAYQAEHGELTKSAKKARAEQFLTDLKGKPKYNLFLSRGAKLPKGMHYLDDYSKMDKTAKADMYRQTWGAAKSGKGLQFVKGAGKAAGKVFKVAGVAMIPSQYAQGADFVTNVYGVNNSALRTMSGVGQAVLPMGPADVDETFDVTQSEIQAGNRGFKAMGNTFLNPTSPRWLPWQVGRGLKEAFVGE